MILDTPISIKQFYIFFLFLFVVQTTYIPFSFLAGICLFPVLYLLFFFVLYHDCKNFRTLVCSIEFIFTTVMFLYSFLGPFVFLIDGYKARIGFFAINEYMYAESLLIYMQAFVIFQILGLCFFKVERVDNIYRAIKKINFDYMLSHFIFIDVIALSCTMFLWFLAGRVGLTTLFNLYIGDARLYFSNNFVMYTRLFMVAYTIIIGTQIITKYREKYKYSIYNLCRYITAASYWFISTQTERRYFTIALGALSLVYLFLAYRKFFRNCMLVVLMIAILLMQGYLRENTQYDFKSALYLSLGEFYLTNVITIYYLNNMPENLEWGQSYILGPLTRLIPRALWQGKPINRGIAFLDESGAPIGLAFNPMAEAILNFGRLATYILPFILYLLVLLSYKSPIPLFFVYMCAYSFNIFRGEFPNIFFDMFVTYIIFLISIKVSK